MKLDDINTKAKELKRDGKEDELIRYAQKVGLTVEDAEDYLDGLVDELATSTYLAGSIIETQAKGIKCVGIIKDWVQSITQIAQNDTEIANNIIEHEDCDLVHCLAQLIRYSFNNKCQVDDKIVSVTMISHNGKEEKLRGPLYIGIPGRAELQKIVREYYGGGRK